MSKFADRKFWTDAFDRAAASFAQALVTASALEELGILGVEWGSALSVAGGFALASLLTSIAFRGNGGEEPQPLRSPYWDPVSAPAETEEA